ncbi:MAG TPA: amidohydrolase family protein [Terriglobales bacterium]|nr:amidohydrolase family protein [Terriglobales bacterium]
MRIRLSYLFFAIFLIICPLRGVLAAQPDSCSAFVNVTVIPMDRQQVLSEQTVVVRGDRIADLGPAKETKVPSECRIIDGQHRYLIPGLVDSHVHLPLAGRSDQLLVLQMLLANGITTGINMEGSPEILALRNDIRDGKLFAPTLYTTGVFIQQPAFMTADQVRHEVIAEKRAGYDFIKVHGELTKDAYDTLFETARAEHIRVVGHVPSNLGIDAALGRQSLIVHAEEYLYSYFQFHRDLPKDPAEIDRMVREISEKTAKSGTWVSPTLYVFRQIIWQAADVNSLLQRPEMQYMPRHLTTGAAVGASNFAWYPPDNPYVKRWAPEKIPYLRDQFSIMQKLVAGLRDAGVPLLAGTDPFVPCVIPGFSLKNELRELHEAGLTPYEVLQSATSNAARFLGNSQDFGTVTKGKVADLVLLNANPLDNIDNISLQEGVMLRGHWFPEDELQKNLRTALKASKAQATATSTTGGLQKPASIKAPNAKP